MFFGNAISVKRNTSRTIALPMESIAQLNPVMKTSEEEKSFLKILEKNASINSYMNK
jgi:hypothetical protein